MAKRTGTPKRPSRPEPEPEPGPGAKVLAALRRYSFVLVLAAAVAGGVLLGISQGDDPDREGFGDVTSTEETTAAPFRSNQEDVRELSDKDAFSHTCGTCHTLRAAGVTGLAGPDLDEQRLTATRVREVIRTGSLDSAMPANLLEGEDAERVARYVARVSRASREARGN